ncbi:uncharacterized protein V6R79_008610 [Siganus canaliculatus]
MESEMKSNLRDMWTPKLPTGLDLELDFHPRTMKQVVNLVIALERFKGSKLEPVLGTEFTDENLLDIMMDSIVEEKTVFECFSTPSADYSQRNQLQCKITDSEKRSLVCVPNSMELHAVMLQGGAENRKVHLNMSTYLNLTPSAEALTVALGIRGTNLYLSCCKDGDEPTLHLEAVDDINTLKNISADSNLVRFLFYKQDNGLNLSTLVSVLYSNWYISTAIENNKPLELCQVDAERHRNFDIQEVDLPKTDEGKCPCEQ